GEPRSHLVDHLAAAAEVVEAALRAAFAEVIEVLAAPSAGVGEGVADRRDRVATRRREWGLRAGAGGGHGWRTTIGSCPVARGKHESRNDQRYDEQGTQDDAENVSMWNLASPSFRPVMDLAAVMPDTALRRAAASRPYRTALRPGQITGGTCFR